MTYDCDYDVHNVRIQCKGPTTNYRGVCSSGSSQLCDILCQYSLSQTMITSQVSFSPIERLFKRKSSNISDTYILYLNI